MKYLFDSLSILTVLTLLTAAVAAAERDAESAAEVRLPAVLTASEHLASLSEERRQNARIQLEFHAVDPGDGTRARAAEAEWAAGRPASAIALIRELERRGVEVSVGTSWLNPIVTPRVPTAGSNALITSSVHGENVREVEIDRDAQTGNLFAVARANGRWAIYTSSNQGTDWAETYYWCCTSVVDADADAAVVGGFYYVVDAPGADVRVRRASVTTGAIDSTYDVTVVTPPAAVEELVAVTNLDYASNRLYVFALLANGSITHHWTQGGTTFNNFSPTVTDADSGLSAAWHTNRGGSPYSLYISYRAGDAIRMVRKDPSSWGAPTTIPYGPATGSHTSISAYDSTVIVGWEYSENSDTFASYSISYDGGNNWLVNPLGGAGSFVPLVWARSTGVVMVYAREDGAFDTLNFTVRPSFWWSSPSPVNDYRIATGSRGGDLNWMGHGWGIAYLVPNLITFSRQAWFTWSPAIYYSGFESGDTSEWSSAVP